MSPLLDSDNEPRWAMWLRSWLARGELRSALPPRSLQITKLEPPATTVTTPYALQGVGSTGLVEWTPAGGLLFVYRGDWDAVTDYLAYDVVLYDGSTWRAVIDNTNVTPIAYGDPGYGDTWELIAAKGDAGSDADVTAHVADTTAHPAANIVVTPAGGISATDVQDALEELDTEKLALAGGTLTGAVSGPEVVIDNVLEIPQKAGAPVDGDFAVPRDGLMVLDTTNDLLYLRTGGAWLSTALT